MQYEIVVYKDKAMSVNLSWGIQPLGMKILQSLRISIKIWTYFLKVNKNEKNNFSLHKIDKYILIWFTAVTRYSSNSEFCLNHTNAVLRLLGLKWEMEMF